MSVDKKELGSYYHEHAAAKAILDLLAPPESKIRRKVTYIDKIEAEFDKREIRTCRAEIVAIFRLLDHAGCGTCIRGIGDRRTRMEWNMDHRLLAGIASANIPVAKKPKIKANGASAEPVAVDVTSEPVETPKQGSLKNLNLIRTGMTHTEVVELLGCEGSKPGWNQPKESENSTYAWDGDEDRWIHFVTFDKNEVVISVKFASFS